LDPFVLLDCVEDKIVGKPSSIRVAEAEASPSWFLAKIEYSPASSAKVMEISNLHCPDSFL
jgi:hypothetical protein